MAPFINMETLAHLATISSIGSTGLTCEGDAGEGEGGGQHHREHPGLVLGGEAGQREGQADEHLHRHCSVCFSVRIYK